MRDLVARRRLDIHAGHADGGVAHHVDAELLRFRELRAHGDAEPVAELGGLAPAHVGARRGGFPERHHLLARAAGIVCHDDVVAVDRAHQVADHAVLVERRLVGIEVFRPFAEPGLLGGGDLLLERVERIAAAPPPFCRPTSAISASSTSAASPTSA